MRRSRFCASRHLVSTEDRENRPTTKTLLRPGAGDLAVRGDARGGARGEGGGRGGVSSEQAPQVVEVQMHRGERVRREACRPRGRHGGRCFGPKLLRTAAHSQTETETETETRTWTQTQRQRQTQRHRQRHARAARIPQPWTQTVRIAIRELYSNTTTTNNNVVIIMITLVLLII